MQLFNLYADHLRFVNVVYLHEYPFFIPSTQHLVICALAYYVFVMESPIYTLSRSTLSFSCLPFPSFSAPHAPWDPRTITSRECQVNLPYVHESMQHVRTVHASTRPQTRHLRWRGGLSIVVSALDQRPRGRRFESAGCGLSCSNRGPVALCTMGLGLLNPPSSRGR